MARLLSIAGREWRDAQRDGRAWWMASLVLLLVLTGLGAGARQLQQVREEQQAAAESERAVWVAQTPKSPHSAAHHGFFVFRAVSPLAMFDPGTLDYVGQIRHLEAHGEQLPRFMPAEDEASIRQLATLTPASTLQIVLPLLLVVLLHGAVSDERESGRLGLLLSQGVSPRLLGIGKLLGGSAPVWLGTAVTIGALAVSLAATGWGPWRDVWTRVCAAAAVHVAWLTLFACAILSISVRAATTRTALVASVALWLGMTVLGPRAAVEIATHVAPSPTPQAFLAALREAEKDRPSYWEDLVPAATARLLVQYGVSHADDLPVSPASVAQLDQEDDDTARVGSVFETLAASHRAQERWLTMLAWATPLVSVRELSSAIAGTDAWHTRAFAARAEQYRRTAVRILNEDSVRHNVGDFLKTGVRHEGDARLWSRIPVFEDAPPRLMTVLERNRAHVVVVATWTVAMVGVLWFTTGRVRVS
ncbi:MAG: DUF3526 domain-containing protein [Acidobacteria bacterium]|nr:DUF3526 domain-containing protein [Acidobacteriota bacterium]